VSVSPVTVELKNNNTTVIYYSNIVPIAASLVVVTQAGDISANPNIETTSLGSINTVININEGGGNNQAFGGIVFPGDLNKVVSVLAAYIIQVGAGTGPFQMAILQPIGTSSAQVVSITDTVTTITGGLFVLPLTTPVTLLGNVNLPPHRPRPRRTWFRVLWREFRPGIFKFDLLLIPTACRSIYIVAERRKIILVS